MTHKVTSTTSTQLSPQIPIVTNNLESHRKIRKLLKM